MSFAPLQVRSLRRRWPDFELRAEFRVEPGERAVIIGRSGSGKTSLLRILAGLEPLAKGEGAICLGDRDLTRLPPERRRIGVVFQEPTLFPGLDLIDNASFAWKVQGLARSERERRVRPWIERVGLLDRLRTPVEALSGGEAQRLALVRALVWEPELLLLDEPFSALDPDLRASVRGALLELHALWPAPLLLVTHDESDARHVATTRIRVQEESGGITRNFIRE